MELEAVTRSSLVTAVVDRLRERILSGAFRPGDRLPPERELAQVLNVTRTTLREALKILETLRLVAIRHGNGVHVQDWLRGGNVEILADLLFRDGALDGRILADILEARQFFAQALARLAARRADPEGIRAYRVACAALASSSDDPGRVQEADLACFDALAVTGGNVVLRFVLNSIRPIYLRHRGVFAGLYRDPKALGELHGRLCDAIEARDEAGAETVVNRLLAFGQGEV